MMRTKFRITITMAATRWTKTKMVELSKIRTKTTKTPLKYQSQ